MTTKRTTDTGSIQKFNKKVSEESVDDFNALNNSMINFFLFNKNHNFE